MTESRTPLCPMGHKMTLIQLACGSWRYGCIRCATSFKARKGFSCGWLSPIKSTKERALEAVLKHPLQKPLTIEEVKEAKAVWIEDDGCETGDELYPALYLSKGYPSHYVFLTAYDDGDLKVWANIMHYGKTWRCWARKPTEEECASVKWEEIIHDS